MIKRYIAEEQALKLVKEIGAAATAHRLGVNKDTHMACVIGNRNVPPP